MRPFVIALTVSVMATGLACNRPSVPPDRAPAQAAPTQPTPAQPAEPNQGFPTRDEVLDYLDGKAVSLSDPKNPPGQDNEPHVLKREQIEFLEVDKGGSRSSDSPWWSTDVNFFVNTGEARYAVFARVDHRLIETKRAFNGFHVKQVSRQ